MSGYFIAMAVAAIFAAATRIGLQGFTFSVCLIAAFCIPFFAVPGLTDAQYMPIERNSPIVGGALAFVAAWVITLASREPIDLALPAGLAVMMAWNASRSFGLVGVDPHALGLELIFYCTLFVFGIQRFVDVGAFFPDPQSFRGVPQWVQYVLRLK